MIDEQNDAWMMLIWQLERIEKLLAVAFDVDRGDL